MMKNLLYKWNLYNLSLVPLYLIFIIQYINIESFLQWDKSPHLEYFYQLIIENWQAVFFIFLILVGLLAYVVFENDMVYGNKLITKFSDIAPSNYDHLTFLSTYIIPLITFNLTEIRSFIVVIILLLMIGIIYMKSNLYYLNPTLLLFGYKIYRAKCCGKAVVVISKKDILKMNDKLTYKDLGNNIYIAKG